MLEWRERIAFRLVSFSSRLYPEPELALQTGSGSATLYATYIIIYIILWAYSPIFWANIEWWIVFCLRELCLLLNFIKSFDCFWISTFFSVPEGKDIVIKKIKTRYAGSPQKIIIYYVWLCPVEYFLRIYCVQLRYRNKVFLKWSEDIVIEGKATDRRCFLVLFMSSKLYIFYSFVV